MDIIKNCLFVVLPIASLGCLWLTVRKPLDESEWRKAFEAIRSRRIVEIDALYPLLLALFFALSTVFGGEAAEKMDEMPASAFIASFLMVPLSLALAVSLPVIARGNNPRDAFGPLNANRRDVAAGLRYGLAMLPPIVLIGLAILAISHMFGGEPIQQQSLKMLVEPGPATWRKGFLIFSTLVLSPIMEEFAFRGVVLTVLSKKRGLVTAVALSSIFFGAIHANLAAFLPLSCVGACFALGYIATGRIAVPIIMHATFNAMSILLNFMAK